MFDEEIEKAILYYIIFEQEDLEIDEKDFVNDRNKKISKAINELKKTKEEISLLTVQNKIKSSNQSDVLEYIASLGNNIYGSSVDILYKKLKDLRKQREVFDLAKKIQQEVRDTENPDVFIEQQIQQLNKINQSLTKDDSFLHQVAKASEELEKKMTEKHDTSLYTGIFQLDDITSGLHKEELTVIGARPRCWKVYVCIANSRKGGVKRNTRWICKFRDVNNSNYK